jgi:hypothetical protein
MGRIRIEDGQCADCNGTGNGYGEVLRFARRSMKNFPVYLCLLILCSCATANKKSGENSALKLPAEASFNKDAGWGGPNDCLCLNLHLEDGTELLFFVNTGMPFTILDKSLDPKLGKPLGKTSIGNLWSGKTTLNEFATPKLFLGDTPLSMDDRIFTGDLSQMPSDHPLMGILGMDCLRRYCVQLDFEKKKIRFLDPRDMKTEDWGRAYPLNFSSGLASTRANFFGQTAARFNIDTGCTIDGALKPELFQREVQRQKPVSINGSKTAAGAILHVAVFKSMTFDNETNYDLVLSDCPDNLLGLRFLARYLVTFNFPQETMYLKPRSLKSLMDEYESMKLKSGQ